MDCSPQGSSVHGILQQEWSGLPCPSPGELPDPGPEPASASSLALTGGLFTTSATWEARNKATHSIILAWRTPWIEEPDVLQSIGSQSWTKLKQLSMHIYTCYWKNHCTSLGPNFLICKRRRWITLSHFPSCFKYLGFYNLLFYRKFRFFNFLIPAMKGDFAYYLLIFSPTRWRYVHSYSGHLKTVNCSLRGALSRFGGWTIPHSGELSGPLQGI